MPPLDPAHHITSLFVSCTGDGGLLNAPVAVNETWPLGKFCASADAGLSITDCNWRLLAHSTIPRAMRGNTTKSRQNPKRRFYSRIPRVAHPVHVDVLALRLLAHPGEHVVSVDVRCPGGKRVHQMAVLAAFGRGRFALAAESTFHCAVRRSLGRDFRYSSRLPRSLPESKFDLVIYFRWTELKTYHTLSTTAVMAWFSEQFLLGLLTQALGAGGIGDHDAAHSIVQFPS
jgi:hypothetical protein